MGDYSFIIDNITFSYSSLSSFETCNYGWKLSYIDYVSKENNFFAQYGSLIHDCMEKYFKEILKEDELLDYYESNYFSYVKINPPPIPPNMQARYYEEGRKYFDNFNFRKNDYTVISVEDKFEFLIEDIMFVGKPDLVLKSKKTEENILIDFKTSFPFKKNKYEILMEKKDKTSGYYKQLYTYTYALREQKGINIDKISLWFPRANKILAKNWNIEEEEKSITWLKNVVKSIKSEEEFNPNTSSDYFCNNLCGVRKHCKFIKI